VELEPRYARGFANLGFAYLHLCRTDEAIDALEEAIKQNPDIVQAWSNLINAFLQKGDIKRAIETGRKLVDKAPDFGLGHNNLAVAYYNDENYEKAIQHLDIATSLGFQAHPDFLAVLEPHRKA
jgi:tetratricopeptide (TPR) repeat protein